MRRFAQLVVLAFVCALPFGCDLIINNPPAETGSPKLKQFTSESELNTYYRDQIRARNSSVPRLETAFGELGGGDDADGGAPGAAPPQASGDAIAEDGNGAGDHSDTTTQEQGVDEADVVKTDGDYIYMIDSTFDGNSVLRIVRASPADAMSVVSETDLEGYGQDLYLRGDTVVAVTSGGGMFYYFGGGGGIADGGVIFAAESGEAEGTDGAEPDVKPDEPIDADVISAPDDGSGDSFAPGDYEYRRPFTVVTIVDVSDRSDPSVSSTTNFDGSPSASRMIDGALHLVLANYQEYYYDVMPMLGRPDLSTSDLDVPELLPDYERVSADGTRSGGDLVTWENLYRPTDPDGFGLITVVSMDTDDPDASFSSVGIVAEPGLIYSSTAALYLTDTNYDYSGDQRTTTDIYKLAYDGASATPVASGSIPGRILNQYSMGEHEGNLRVASTVDPLFFFDENGSGGLVTEPVNAVYVLSPSEDTLAITGRVENIAPGETIQSARFTGNRGYLVTFRQVDPLFTMDLSDPANPQLVGELHVPGFSTFLVPMDQDHVLAVGQYVPPPGEFGAWGVQLSIFDVSDFANPTRSANLVVGGDVGSYSEALWNPKAFTYFAEHDLVALPISVYGGYFVDDLVGIGFDGAETDVDGDAGVTDGGSSSSGEEPDAPPPADEPRDDVVDPSNPFVEGFEGLVVLRATAEDGLVELGRISTQFDEAMWWYPSFTRGVFIGDHVYAVTNIGVRAASTDDVESVVGELFYGPEDPVEPLPTDPGVIVDPMPVEPDGGIGSDPMTPEGGSGG